MLFIWSVDGVNFFGFKCKNYRDRSLNYNYTVVWLVDKCPSSGKQKKRRQITPFGKNWSEK